VLHHFSVQLQLQNAPAIPLLPEAAPEQLLTTDQVEAPPTRGKKLSTIAHNADEYDIQYLIDHKYVNDEKHARNLIENANLVKDAKVEKTSRGWITISVSEEESLHVVK
jgi:hypothetical protein